MNKRSLLVSFACFLLTVPVFGDVVIELRSASTSATTQPSADESVIRVLAIPGHNFFATFTADGQTISVSGLVKALPDGRFRTKIKIEKHRGQGSNGIELTKLDTTVDAELGQTLTLSGSADGTEKRALELTMKPPE